MKLLIIAALLLVGTAGATDIFIMDTSCNDFVHLNITGNYTITQISEVDHDKVNETVNTSKLVFDVVNLSVRT